jgi:peptidoglycan/xylan/chitin deacetylase (PgdA/CDA1 family)
VLITFDDCYSDLIEAGLPVLLDENAPSAAYAVAERVGQTNDWDRAIGAPELPLLDADGLRALQEAGVEIGAHGATHRVLAHLWDQPDVLAGETAGAAARLGALGLAPLRTFAYPHGEHDPAVRAAVAASGLEAAFTVAPGIVRPDTDPYRLPRIEVLHSDGHGLRFLVKVAAAGRLPVRRPPRIWRYTRRRVRRLRRSLC